MTDLRAVGRGLEYVPAVVRPQLDDVVRRAQAAGARPPLEYVGAGMTSVVFRDARAIAFKVARGLDPIYRSMIETEAEWLVTAAEVPWLRDHVARLHAHHADLAVIERECVRGSPGTWGRSSRLRDLHADLERAMLPWGWTAPEFKEDSYVLHRGRGAVLVDASMPLRVGARLVRYAFEVLRGQRPWSHDRPEDLAFYVRREIGLTIPERLGTAIVARILRLRGSAA